MTPLFLYFEYLLRALVLLLVWGCSRKNILVHNHNLTLSWRLTLLLQVSQTVQQMSNDTITLLHWVLLLQQSYHIGEENNYILIEFKSCYCKWCTSIIYIYFLIIFILVIRGLLVLLAFRAWSLLLFQMCVNTTSQFAS